MKIRSPGWALLLSHVILWAAVVACGAAPLPLKQDADVTRLIAVIAQVGSQGAGASEARLARDELAQRGVDILPALIVAMDTRNVLAANWYRTAWEAIVRRESKQPEVAWPVAFLQEYINDAARLGPPRRLALALLDERQPGFSATWIPTRLADPVFGYEAVAHALKTGEQLLRDKQVELAKIEFRKAFEHARDSAQVVQAATRLKTLGETVDSITHLGLVVNWWLVGPFHAPEKTGFARSFEPEHSVDLKGTFKGKGDKPIAWREHHATDKLGQLNLIDVFGTTNEAVAYAYAEIDVPQAQSAQLRCGADDNCSVWLNGRQILAREQWLNGTRFDRFITPIDLSAGKNLLLVKVCQGPQGRDPEASNPWSLQLRLCNEHGQGVVFQPLSPQPVAPPSP